jgi:two-component system, chemotaxis family, protein-glutamate methylesterase/glutaminase
VTRVGPADRGDPQPQILRVLVVDDSAVVRQALSSILSQDPAMRVRTAPDPIIAAQKMAQEPVDVLILDLEMPRMDGLTFLRRIMADDPLPVVICSGAVGPGKPAAMQALQDGAVAIIAKPELGVKAFLEESSVMLLDAVRGAAQARVGRRGTEEKPSPGGAGSGAIAGRQGQEARSEVVVAIGASTGGTEALRHILGALPADAPGMVIVQHMPEAFVPMFAQSLDQGSALRVRQAASGDRVLRGHALIAPGNRHLVLVRTPAGISVETVAGPLVSRHRPSVDMLFRSTAQVAGERAVGVILTGMGADGAQGLLEMRRQGAATIAQDEESSIVFGMPREAIACGASSLVAPLKRIPGLILETARRQEVATSPRLHP